MDFCSSFKIFQENKEIIKKTRRPWIHTICSYLEKPTKTKKTEQSSTNSVKLQKGRILKLMYSGKHIHLLLVLLVLFRVFSVCLEDIIGCGKTCHVLKILYFVPTFCGIPRKLSVMLLLLEIYWKMIIDDDFWHFRGFLRVMLKIFNLSREFCCFRRFSCF